MNANTPDNTISTRTPEQVHTPTPWRLHATFKDVICAGAVGLDAVDIADCSKGPRAISNYETRIANAALIVRAVNAHDDMKAALEAAEKFIAPQGGALGGDWESSGQNVLAQIRAALSKAKGA